MYDVQGLRFMLCGLGDKDEDGLVTARRKRWMDWSGREFVLVKNDQSFVLGRGRPLAAAVTGSAEADPSVLPYVRLREEEEEERE